MLLTYLPLAPILLLLLTASVLLFLRIWRPRFAYFWLVAASGALLVLPLALLLRRNLPQLLPLSSWQPESFFASSPALLVDNFSWPFAVALASLALAVILTDVARASDADWSAWAGSLALSALGLLAVLAGNPLTLLLAWAAIDLAELLILLGHVKRSRERERVVIAFSARVAGTLLLIWGGIVAEAGGSVLAFSEIPLQSSLYLLLASGLRLGVVPLHFPFLHEPHLRRGLGTIVRLVPAAASLVLLARTGTVGVSGTLSPYLLALAGLAAVYSGFSWFFARDELEGRPFWLLGMASLALASAVRAQPAASLSWGVAALLSGGLLFLFSARHRYLLPLPVLSFLALLLLPFTPTWQAGLLYSPPFSPLWLLFILAQVLLVAGYLDHALLSRQPLAGVERWVWLIYPLGLAILPISHYLTGWLGWQGAPGQELSLVRFLPSVTVLGLLTFLAIWGRRLPGFPERLTGAIRSFFSLRWLYRVLWGIYIVLGRLTSFINLVFEGDGGVLWSLLVLTLLIAYLFQSGLGG